MEDPIELFFLQVQGSGRIELPSGELLRVGYADQNGYPYKSIGKWLIDKGELTPARPPCRAFAWAQANPARLTELLNSNPSYVFFRRLNNNQGRPAGRTGRTADRWLQHCRGCPLYPLGAPVWLSTSFPLGNQPLQRLHARAGHGRRHWRSAGRLFLGLWP